MKQILTHNIDYAKVAEGLGISEDLAVKFFNDGSLKPDESLMFLVRFIPFAEVRGTGNTILKD